MRTRTTLAVIAAAALLSAPTTAVAGKWSDAGGLIKRRPIAVLVAIPSFVVTAPFMLVQWAFSDSSSDDE